MKVSTFVLSFCGLCVLYISNADWIDELIESYLASEEEIAPFVSSVTAGTEEFDQMVEERSHSKRKWLFPFVFALTMFASFLTLSVMLQCHAAQPLHGRGALETALKFLSNLKNPGTDKEEIQNIVTEFLEKKLKQLLKSKQSEDVPVRLLWKGGSLVESSIHCSIKDESKHQHVQRHLLHSRLLFDSGNQREDKIFLAPSCSETSTARKIAEIRKMLESEQELEGLAEEGAEACGRVEGIRGRRGVQKRAEALAVEYDVPEEAEDYGWSSSDKSGRLREEILENAGHAGGGGRREAGEANLESEPDCDPDPKLMNRIRLLESRLRLEELKNKNWINRMSKAEGILQKLNKQVEQIEESRPMGTLTETLKITSTVWSPSAHPKRNMRFTLVNQYPSCCAREPYKSLSELIKNEVGLPSPNLCSKKPFRLPPTPHLPALPSPIVMPQSSILGKFLSR